MPDEDDIVHARDPTSGLDYYHFGVHKMRMTIHDMGGQMVERVCELKFSRNFSIFFRRRKLKMIIEQ